MSDDKGETMNIKINETDLLDLLGENGERWVQGKWGDGVQMCLHGAIRRCSPQPGDAYLVEQVAERQGWGTSWNDADGTSWQMIRQRLAHIEVTDTDLAETFGPQWPHIVALVRRAAVLTADEAKRLDAVVAVSNAIRRSRAGLSDLIGEYGFRQEHYDALTELWRTVIGAVHPDDEAHRE